MAMSKSMLTDLQNLVEKEKQRQADALNANIEEKKKQDAALVKQAALKKENDAFQEFIKNNVIGAIDPNNINFKSAENKLSFADCLKKAYDPTFMPYLSWKALDTMPNKGTCLLGNYENDETDFLAVNTPNTVPVFLTPAKNNATEPISSNLDARTNTARMNLVKRMRRNLHETNLNLLHEKNKNSEINENNLKNNYRQLSSLDKTILTTTEKIRQTDSHYRDKEKLYRMLVYILTFVCLIIFAMSIYYLVKNN